MNNIEKHKELILSALINTDNYLFIYNSVKESGVASVMLAKEFDYFKDEALRCLTELGCAHEHIEYINKISIDMLKFYEESNMFKVEELQSFKDFITEAKEIEEKLSDSELDNMAKSVKWDDIYDLYDKDEIVVDHDDELKESISVQGRLQRSLGISRRKAQLALARSIKLKRSSTMETLKKRAKVASKRLLYKKFLMGRKKSQLSPGEKSVIESRVKRMRNMQAVLIVKLLPVLRDIEQKRLARR